MALKTSAPLGIPRTPQTGLRQSQAGEAIQSALAVVDRRRARNSAANVIGSAPRAPVSAASAGTKTSGDLRNFLWGVGDAALIGFGDELRDAVGIDPVDMESNAYAAGEIAGGLAMLATGVGGGIRAAGAAAKGLEFSHFIPKRLGGARSIWNGNFVPIKTHALSDPFRYRFMPRWWKEANPMQHRVNQLWTRTPNAVKGTAAGAVAGGSGVIRSGQ